MIFLAGARGQKRLLLDKEIKGRQRLRKFGISRPLFRGENLREMHKFYKLELLRLKKRQESLFSSSRFSSALELQKEIDYLGHLTKSIGKKIRNAGNQRNSGWRGAVRYAMAGKIARKKLRNLRSLRIK